MKLMMSLLELLKIYATRFEKDPFPLISRFTKGELRVFLKIGFVGMSVDEGKVIRSFKKIKELKWLGEDRNYYLVPDLSRVGISIEVNEQYLTLKWEIFSTKQYDVIEERISIERLSMDDIYCLLKLASIPSKDDVHIGIKKLLRYFILRKYGIDAGEVKDVFINFFEPIVIIRNVHEDEYVLNVKEGIVSRAKVKTYLSLPGGTRIPIVIKVKGDADILGLRRSLESRVADLLGPLINKVSPNGLSICDVSSNYYEINISMRLRREYHIKLTPRKFIISMIAHHRIKNYGILEKLVNRLSCKFIRLILNDLANIFIVGDPHKLKVYKVIEEIEAFFKSVDNVCRCQEKLVGNLKAAKKSGNKALAEKIYFVLSHCLISKQVFNQLDLDDVLRLWDSIDRSADYVVNKVNEALHKLIEGLKLRFSLTIKRIRRENYLEFDAGILKGSVDLRYIRNPVDFIRNLIRLNEMFSRENPVVLGDGTVKFSFGSLEIYTSGLILLELNLGKAIRRDFGGFYLYSLPLPKKGGVRQGINGKNEDPIVLKLISLFLKERSIDEKRLREVLVNSLAEGIEPSFDIYWRSDLATLFLDELKENGVNSALIKWVKEKELINTLVPADTIARIIDNDIVMMELLKGYDEDLWNKVKWCLEERRLRILTRV